MRGGILVTAALALVAQVALTQKSMAQETFVVAPKTVGDEKAVFATVESANIAPARARIGGTVAELAVQIGDAVKQGQVLATIADEKLLLQMKSLDAQIAGLEAQFAQTQTDLTRDEELFSRGTVPKTTLDQARTAFNVASNALKSRTAERSVTQQQIDEGHVLAPTAGRVLTVPVTVGTVVLSGETIASIAEQHFLLRLRVPERHARFLKAGDSVRGDRGGRQRGAGRRQCEIRQHQAGLSTNPGRSGRCRRNLGRCRRLLGRRAYFSVGFIGRARKHHRAERFYHHALWYRLCARAQERRDDRCAGAAWTRIAAP